MTRDQAINRAAIFRRGSMTFISNDDGIFEHQHKSINEAKRSTHGHACVALKRGEQVPDRAKQKEAA